MLLRFPPPHIGFTILVSPRLLSHLSSCCFPLSGSLPVSVDELPPSPPVSDPSFPSSSSSSSSVFSPSLSGGWTPERMQRGSAPNRNARIPPRTDLPLDTQSPFVWRRGELTECSASCGKGQILIRHLHLDVSFYKNVLPLSDTMSPSSGSLVKVHVVKFINMSISVCRFSVQSHSVYRSLHR